MKPIKQTFCCLLIICVLFCFGVIQIQAQNYDTTNITHTIDTIAIQKTAFGKSYYLKNKSLTIKHLSEITACNTLAHQEIKRAQSYNVLGCVFGFLGGGCIGYPIGTLLGGGEPLWALAGVGVGFLVICIPIVIAVDRHLAKGVAIYNQGLQQTNANTVYFRLDFTPTGIGVVMKF